MVSPQNIPVNRGDTASSVSSTVPTTGRGLVHPEEAQTYYYVPEGTPSLPRAYVTWGSVIAGALVSFALLGLSASLAYACGVPAFANTGAYGWGAGIWSVVTCAIAFWVGGCVSSYMSSGLGNRAHALLHGVMAWGLALPLILVVFEFAAGRSLILADIGRMLLRGDLGFNAQQTGAAWGSFISLAVGLIFAAIGGISALGMISAMPGVRSTSSTVTTETRPAM